MPLKYFLISLLVALLFSCNRGNKNYSRQNIIEFKSNLYAVKKNAFRFYRNDDLLRWSNKTGQKFVNFKISKP